MMKKFPYNDEHGFVLVLALTVMAILVLIGAAAINTMNFELQIAGSDAAMKESFYQADGGGYLAAEVLEQNIACQTGFTENSSSQGSPGALLGGVAEGVFVPRKSLNFWINVVGTSPRVPSETVRDMYFPANYAAGEPHTSVTVDGMTKAARGGAMQQAAGYMGLGKSLGSGGSTLLFNIYSYHEGLKNAESLVRLQWRYRPGSSGGCYY